MSYITFIPFRLDSFANIRMNPSAGRSKQRELRFKTAAYFRPQEGIKRPYAITLTRLGKKKLDDDNLAYAFKRVRDVISEILGEDDGSKHIVFIYKQSISSRVGFYVEVETLTLDKIKSMTAEYRGNLLLRLL